MFLIIGLGNPGKKYTHNRHNAGFILLDEIQKEWDFPEFEFDKKFNTEMTEGISPSVIPSESHQSRLTGEAEGSAKIVLAKPSTFMNNSGKAVRKILDFYKLAPENIIVIHDDLDIEIGKYKISKDSSAAGHNGVQSIIDHLGTHNFKRIRLGVETEGGRTNRQIPGEDFVLQNFSEEEMEKIKNIKNDVLEEIKKLS